MHRLATPDVFVRQQARVGEGPLADDRRGELAWVDIPNGRLFRCALDGSESGPSPVQLATSLGAVGRRSAGGYVAATGDGLGVLGEDGRLTLVHPLLPDPELRMNDAKCDPRGRFLAGSTTLDFQRGRGVLHMWDPFRDGSDTVRPVLDGLTLPNGLGWSPDGSRIYLADTKRALVLVADYDLDSGTLGAARELISVPERDGAPDGLCVDTDGCLWIAMWGGAVVHRYDPQGRLVAIVPMPVSQPSSCAFAADGRLFITSAAEDTDADAEPLAGSVFVLPTDHRGVPVGEFAG